MRPGADDGGDDRAGETPTRTVGTRTGEGADEAPTRHPVGSAAPSAGASGLSVVKVTGQAFAAVTTAAVGSFIGGAGGTVAGAGIAAVVTTVGDAFYQRSIERTRDHVRRRLRRGRAGVGRGSEAAGARDATTLVAGGARDGTIATAGPSHRAPGPDEDPTVVLGANGADETTRAAPASATRALGGDDPTRAVGRGTRVMTAPDDEATALHGAPGGPTGPDDPDDPDAEPARRVPWRRYGVLVATALLVFLVAMLAITGIERIKGSPLSGGESGTSVGAVLGTAEPPTSSRGAPETTTSAPAGRTSGATTTPGNPTSGAQDSPEPTVTITSRLPRLVPTGVLPGR